MTFTARQSLLASYEQCPRRALLGMEVDDDITTGNVGASADLGSAFHAVAAEMLRTMWRQGEAQMPHQEAIEVMREVLANGPWVLPADERDDLRWMVLGFCEHQWHRLPNPDWIERRLFADITCPDGKVRTVAGQPDVIIADPPQGAVVVDYKSGKGKPKSPRDDPDAKYAEGKRYLSDRGHFQLDTYGFLVMRNFPPIAYTTLRELHLRSGKVREATLRREELEHVEWELGDHLQKLEEGIAAPEGSPLRKPRSGEWCARKCPVQASCPIPQEQRGAGALATPELADEAAARFVVVDGLRNTLRDQIKAAYEQTGRPPEVGDGRAAFWREKPNGKGREFGIFDLDECPRPPSDEELMEQLEASVAQAEARRANG